MASNDAGREDAAITAGRTDRIPAPSWRAYDLEGDSAPIDFDGDVAATTHADRQNAQQGRRRWVTASAAEGVPDRADGTPIVFVREGAVSISDAIRIGCAECLEVAAAAVHASEGRRRIAGRIVLTCVDDEVVLEVDEGSGREWRMSRTAARSLGMRLASLAISCSSSRGGGR